MYSTLAAAASGSSSSRQQQQCDSRRTIQPILVICVTFRYLLIGLSMMNYFKRRTAKNRFRPEKYKLAPLPVVRLGLEGGERLAREGNCPFARSRPHAGSHKSRVVPVVSLLGVVLSRFSRGAASAVRSSRKFSDISTWFPTCAQTPRVEMTLLYSK